MDLLLCLQLCFKNESVKLADNLMICVRVLLRDREPGTSVEKFCTGLAAADVLAKDRT